MTRILPSTIPSAISTRGWATAPKPSSASRAVGDAYAAQGFTVKGIAMYKKITKLQPSMDGSLKLAELYTQQGLFNDARAQYLQVAEDFMKSGRPGASGAAFPEGP